MQSSGIAINLCSQFMHNSWFFRFLYGTHCNDDDVDDDDDDDDAINACCPIFIRTGILCEHFAIHFYPISFRKYPAKRINEKYIVLCSHAWMDAGKYELGYWLIYYYVIKYDHVLVIVFITSTVSIVMILIWNDEWETRNWFNWTATWLTIQYETTMMFILRTDFQFKSW